MLEELTNSIFAVHVERDNVRLKYFKAFSFIPPYIRCYAEKLVTHFCALVHLQTKEIRDTADLEKFK